MDKWYVQWEIVSRSFLENSIFTPSFKIWLKKVFFLKNDGKGYYQRMVQDKEKSLSFT